MENVLKSKQKIEAPGVACYEPMNIPGVSHLLGGGGVGGTDAESVRVVKFCD